LSLGIKVTPPKKNNMSDKHIEPPHLRTISAYYAIAAIGSGSLKKYANAVAWEGASTEMGRYALERKSGKPHQNPHHLAREVAIKWGLVLFWGIR